MPEGKVARATAVSSRLREHHAALAARRERIRQLEVQSHELAAKTRGWAQERELLQKLEGDRRLQLQHQVGQPFYRQGGRLRRSLLVWPPFWVLGSVHGSNIHVCAV